VTAIEKALRTVLTADAPVTALVAGRIYPEHRQQGSDFPAITYQLLGTSPQNSANGHTNITRATMAFDCIATSYSAAKTLAETVRQALMDYSGTSEGVVVKSCHHDGDNTIIEDSQVAEDRGVSRIISDYIVWYES
tara:strand:- start:151 stop:558 length:408 start_codon:yes stop_codon:yes gene_type:complete